MNVNILLQQHKKKLLNIHGLKNNINRNYQFNILLRCDATKNIHGDDDIDNDNGSNECCAIVYDEKNLSVKFCNKLNKYLQNKEQEKNKIGKNNETVKKIRAKTVDK